MHHLCYLCLVFVMFSRLFIALWSHAGNRLTSWLSFVMFNCVFITFPCSFLGQVWYLMASIPGLAAFLIYFFIQKGRKEYDSSVFVKEWCL